MIQAGGIELCEYGNKENQIWKDIGIKIPGRWARAEQIVYGPTPSDWSIIIRHVHHIPIYKLHSLPGAFIENCSAPTTIMWPRTREEEDEGRWERVETKRVLSEPVDVRYINARLTEPFTELVESAQDDSGVVMLMQYRASRTRSSASRSHSQPSSIRRREAAYQKVRYSHRHPWLNLYHLCPFNSQWQFGYNRGESFGLRSCIKDTSHGRSSVQESWSWWHSSFLADISQCQGQDPYFSESSKSLRHTAARDCPQKCSQVHLNRLQVPASLRRFHPRQYI